MSEAARRYLDAWRLASSLALAGKGRLVGGLAPLPRWADLTPAQRAEIIAHVEARRKGR